MREWRTYALIELAWARSARAAAQAGIAAHRPRAVLYSSTTAALLAPAPGAIRFDAPAAGNRPGPPRALAAAGRAAAAGGARRCWCRGARAGWPRRRGRAPTRSSCPCRWRRAGAAAGERDIAAITYGANPEKKGLDRVLAAWAAARRPGEELVVAGLDGARRRDGGALHGDAAARGVPGAAAARARVRLRARGARTTGSPSSRRWPTAACSSPRPSPGPYAALPVARALDPRLVSDDLAGGAPRSALDDPAPGLRRARARRARAVAARGGRPRGRRAAAPAVTVARMTPLSGQSVLITGAAHGIGAEVARRLAARGARVSLVGLGADELRRVAADCPGAIVFDADVTDQEALDAAVAGTVEAFGGIDTVFANAGIGAPGFVRTMDPASFERVIEVNLIGVWRTIRACLPHVIERRGYVLPVASMAAIVPAPGLGGLRRGQVGRRGARRRAAVEVQGFGVDVGVAYFSWIDTEMVRGADRTELGARCARCSRARSRAPIPSATPPRRSCAGIEQPQPHRRLPALAAGADGDPPAAPVADRAHRSGATSPSSTARRARGRRARLGPGRRGRGGGAGRREASTAH